MVNPTTSTTEIYNYRETTLFISQIGELSREKQKKGRGCLLWKITEVFVFILVPLVTQLCAVGAQGSRSWSWEG